MFKKISSLHKISFYLFTLFIFNSQHAFAESTGMPWESILQKVVSSLGGPVARMIIILAIIGTGAALIFGEMGGVAKKLIGVVCGGAIIAVAVSWAPSFFGWSGSCLML